MSEGTSPVRDWQVSVALPIEASSRAEAVQQFWEYVRTLGADELPAFVCPYGNELDTLAFVGGSRTDLDPEED